MIVGHENVLAAMAQPAPVMLFLGPRGVGKMLVARELGRRWGIPAAETHVFPALDTGTARALVALTTHVGPRRLVIVRLNRTTARVQNILLKTLEETEGTLFVLLAEEVPIDTILSRSRLAVFSPLTQEQISTVLQRRGYGAKKAAALAALSSGTVRSALGAESMLETKAAVLAAVKAIAEQDPVSLDKLSTKWTEEHTTMLRRWVHEVLSRNFGVFAEEDAILPRPTALKILIALSSDIRPKLQVRAGLMGLVVAA